MLSAREVGVLTLLATGYGNQGAAHRLKIAPATVATHRRNVMRKLGLRSQTDLVLFALRSGLVAADQAGRLLIAPLSRMNNNPSSAEITGGPQSASQERAARMLRAFARLYYEGGIRHGITLRTTPLLIGPSGVGKTHLVRELGRSLQLPVMKATVGDWLPHGVKHEAPTLHRLEEAVEKHDLFILHLDELDKFRSTEGTWALSVLTEIFSVLDRDPGGTWSLANLNRLRRNVFIIGSGTWQDQWDQDAPKPPLGFGTSAAPGGVRPALAARIRKARVIPPELLNRFNDHWLVLEPYEAADFRRIAHTLGLGEGVIDPVAAAASGLNFRAIENILTTHALQALLDQEPAASVRSLTSL